MTVSSISAVSFSAWALPAANVISPRVEKNTDDNTSDSDATSLNETNSSEMNGAEAGPKKADGTPMAPEEIQLLEQLKQTDREVRQHEMAHQIAGGAYTGGASYEYEVGPDGKRYAVAGEVPIDYGPVPGDPQATIEKMQTVIAAAMAPADPSPKDHQVAAQARQYLLEAKLEASMQRSEMEQARASGQGSSAATTPAVDEQAA
ncbi:hypothetical protein LCGC14_0185350 [marine sediment metagenome]|uniref:SprA-related family protein n=1 Tax=marine sediment metagenome TaxID=412755 RepID=A0A0F9USR3_9ZZZZ|nr:putative metalloprotease CJM1_0395 family protein [Halomonas sp.]HDZ49271.1 SprA-related family protein [Halomonas sp.]HEB05117.1 SprA-related family protein [Halomonas sp.]